MASTELTVAITGGTAGVGRATAHAFAKAGYRIGLIARGRRGLEETAAELAQYGHEVLAVSADVADAQAVEDAAEHIEQALGAIDIWVNCAMVTVFAPVRSLTADEIKRVTEVTYLGYVHGTMAALRRMQERDRGTIVQVGSALAYRSIPIQSAYCGAKFAIRGFTDALRCELIHDSSKVRLTMVQLPAHNTPQFDWARSRLPKRPQPVPPIHAPEVAARAILRAATDAPRELWLGKASLQAILGSMAVPGLLDRMMAKQAWDGQMNGPIEAESLPDNLYEPVDKLHRTAGRFGDRATSKALGLASETVGLGLAIATGLIAGTVMALTAWLA